MIFVGRRARQDCVCVFECPSRFESLGSLCAWIYVYLCMNSHVFDSFRSGELERNLTKLAWFSCWPPEVQWRYGALVIVADADAALQSEGTNIN